MKELNANSYNKFLLNDKNKTQRIATPVTCNCRTSKTPPHGNVLYLNGEGSGLVNNACFPSAVAPSYAPPGQVRHACTYRLSCVPASIVAVVWFVYCLLSPVGAAATLTAALGTP